MAEEKFKISIAHLYPELLNLYGDYGNILALKQRCEWRNIAVSITNIHVGTEIDSSKYDLYFIGGGQDMQQIAVADELQKNKEALLTAATNNSVFLAICGGYQLLGEYYKPAVGKCLNGIGLLDIYTEAGEKRFISNVVANSDFVTPSTLVGFENHSGLTYINGEKTKPIAKIIVGNGNNGMDKTEGARKNNVFGTYLHGSFLPKNPHFADYLIKLALEKKYNKEIKLQQLDDTIELLTHEKLLKKNH